MQTLASEVQPSATPESDLPDAQVLWLRAQLFERQAAAENAQRVLQWVEVAWVIAACVGLGFWLALNWNEIGDEVANWLGWSLFDAWPTLWTRSGIGHLVGFVYKNEMESIRLRHIPALPNRVLNVRHVALLPWNVMDLAPERLGQGQSH